MGLISHGHIKDISSTTKRLVERCLKAEWCVELDNLDPSTGLATVASIGGGEVREKPMQKAFTVEGLPYLSTNINETPTSQATERTIAATADSTPSISSSMPTLTEAVSTSTSSNPLGSIQTTPQFTSNLTTSEIMSLSPDSTDSLPLPRTRDKRVLSLSNPRPPHAAVLAAVGQESPSGRRVASTSSARSAPPTPPRRDSTISNASNTNSEMDGLDSAFSTSSSWHAHMVDPSSSSSSTTTPIPVSQARTPSPSQSSTSSSTSHHPYFHHSLSDNAHSLPRVGSPLSSDATSHFYFNGAAKSSEDLARVDSHDSTASSALNHSSFGMSSKSRSGTLESNASSLDCNRPIFKEDAKPMKPRRRPPPATPLAAAAAALKASTSTPKSHRTEEVSIRVPSLHIQEASGEQTIPEGEILSLNNQEAVEEAPRSGRRALTPSSSEPYALSSNPSSRCASPSTSQTGSSSGGRRRPPPPPSSATPNSTFSAHGSKAPPPPVNRATKSKPVTPRSGTPEDGDRERIRSASENQEDLYRGVNGLRVG